MDTEWVPKGIGYRTDMFKLGENKRKGYKQSFKTWWCQGAKRRGREKDLLSHELPETGVPPWEHQQLCGCWKLEECREDAKK